MYNSRVRSCPVWAAYALTAALLLPGSFCLAVTTTWAQPHTVSAGPYTLRASTIYSLAIPERIATANGIVRDPLRAVVNVMVSAMRGNTSLNQRARVHATARGLTGQTRDIPMREIVANGQVSYLGTYDFVAGEVIEFTIDAAPLGSGRKLSLTFRDRLWPAK